MTDRKGMTTSEYAAHRRCSDSFVRRLKREKLLVLTDAGLIDVAASDAKRAREEDGTSRGGKKNSPPKTPRAPKASVSPPAAPPADAPAPEDTPTDPGDSLPPPGSVRAMQREKLEQEVVRLRMDNLAAAKRTANRATVERALFTLARQTMTRLQALPTRLRASLAKETDPAKCEALLAAEIAKLCEDMQREARLLREKGLDAKAKVA